MNDEFTARVAEIVEDRRSGAAELARRSLAIIADAAERMPAVSSEGLRTDLQQLAEALSVSRPSMTSVLRLVSLWREQVTAETSDLDEVRANAAETARSLARASRVATQEAAAHAARLLSDCRTLVTYSYSSTVALAISRLPTHVQVFFSEGRPLYEGHRLAQALSESGRQCTLMTDAQLGSAVRRSDAVLVGADSILPDGALVNKAGTLSLAATAKHFAIPFYACCERFKFRTAGMPDVTLERMDAKELGAPGWPGVTIENVYFDITPARLVSGCITETGLQTNADYGDAVTGC